MAAAFSPARDPIWNLPLKRLDDRWDLFNHILGQFVQEKGFTPDRRCKFLELGVWHAVTLPRTIKRFGGIFNYTGVDPYGRLTDDPYKGLFWENSAEADEVYSQAKSIFDSHGATLIRDVSQRFLARSKDSYDVIFVDGDHRYQGALDDCEAAFEKLKSGGLLIVDDYGNSFHPEVDWAVREFVNRNRNEIGRMGAHPVFFELEGMHAPVMLMFVCFERK